MSSNLLAEINPPAVRGVVTGLSIVLIDAAAMPSTGAIYVMSTTMAKRAYEIPLSIELVFAVLITVGIYSIEDSPSYFLMQGKDDVAMRYLSKIRQGEIEPALLAELATMKAQYM